MLKRVFLIGAAAGRSGLPDESIYSFGVYYY
jgi:hypothetical protein